MTKKVFIWGAGGHGRVLLGILRGNKKMNVAFFVDDNPDMTNKKIDGVTVLGTLDNLKSKKISGGIGGVGDNIMRGVMGKEIEKRGFNLINAIDKSCVIASGVSIGKGVTLWPGVIVNFYAVIGNNVIINCGAIVEHECVIGEAAHIGPGAKLAGRVVVGEGSFVGMGAVVKEGVKIGKNSIIGAGAVVIEDVPDNVVVAGIPAKIIKQK